MCGVEPPIGIEPMTYALRETCSLAPIAWPAQITRGIAAVALIALEFPGLPFHELARESGNDLLYNRQGRL